MGEMIFIVLAVTYFADKDGDVDAHPAKVIGAFADPVEADLLADSITNDPTTWQEAWVEEVELQQKEPRDAVPGV